MNKKEQLQQLKDSGIVAVIRRPPYNKVIQITDALVSGGVGALEVTVDTDRAYEIITQLKERYEGKALVGAGTVLDEQTAKAAIEAGADFIFSPILDEATIRLTNQYGRISIPGVMTPTEIVKGYQYGADMLKIFPGSSLGVNYIKELSAPLGHIPMMPTGGVTLDNVGPFIRAGAVAVGIGSSLTNVKAIAEERYEELTRLARQFRLEIKKARE
ncbi:bifunctional 4-hydroxy-2-oxoglutarate aldolase/2-dehydro-3-deoxy-phosphogluconate aldolase [Paenibacillus sp. LHD-38]|uniref:bifunctional 4-hydroxy-2-oxoglutarate aldolase/2-dehydro-3-deoxy-phosphogluconate aldolase n=1 Tax=Paenibacillus sp. LHD-38 TaxID=3072143 RepID=UPI0028105520|nr:bifunctional 4-hydroxy-2-oxoglutarate aldolase/2-dehydro-3-deoxy-phosphogluconate aldolase [Paenibacillus sp. LHD-38]MDQ8735109.1 bifunctional 4-hydroxy-2-oxoglutarate aldolase/2-dehydro-3-deoxy-phosphogluconate aldolase [Paenibacillus sp. LHD-38]